MGISPEGCHVNAEGDEMLAHDTPHDAERDDVDRLANLNTHPGPAPALEAVRATAAETALLSGLRPRGRLLAGWAKR